MDASLPSQDGEHLNTEPVLGVRGCLSPASVSLCYTFPGICSHHRHCLSTNCSKALCGMISHKIGNNHKETAPKLTSVDHVWTLN